MPLVAKTTTKDYLYRPIYNFRVPNPFVEDKADFLVSLGVSLK